MEYIINQVIQFFDMFLSSEIIIFIISMIPALELRGGLIAASLLGVDWKIAMILCIIGNIIPVPFILLFINKIFELLKRTKLKGIVYKIEKKANKNSSKVLKYENLGLYLFVALPLPGTGAWTGALIASMLGMKFKNAFISICLGILTAAVIMALFSYGVLGMLISAG